MLVKPESSETQEGLGTGGRANAIRKMLGGLAFHSKRKHPKSFDYGIFPTINGRSGSQPWLISETCFQTARNQAFPSPYLRRHDLALAHAAGIYHVYFLLKKCKKLGIINLDATSTWGQWWINRGISGSPYFRTFRHEFPINFITFCLGISACCKSPITFWKRRSK